MLLLLKNHQFKPESTKVLLEGLVRLQLKLQPYLRLKVLTNLLYLKP